MIILIK